VSADKTVTQWFAPSEPPVRNGWYQRDYGHFAATAMPDFWDGKNWLYGDGNGIAYIKANSIRPWRGLANKPRKS
jgi:hypothetical protein